MNKISIKASLPLLCSTLLFSACIDEEMPTDVATAGQVSASTQALDGLLYGLTGSMVEFETYSSSYPENDWGYPCQMIERDVLTGDFPVKVTGSNYDYFSYLADGTSLRFFPIYTYFYYYTLINNANGLISQAGGASATGDYKPYAGNGYAYRAMAYLDLARMFEFRETGFTELDAQASDVWGLTVPIVVETTTQTEARANTRAPFYTMYRFILSDLEKASSMLASYSRTDKTLADTSVVNGLKARFWLELGTRFDKHPDDLTQQLAHENDADGYQPLGIQTANDCYAKAADYAQRAMEGYSQLTLSTWYNAKTGFNTANDDWIWAASIGAKEMVNSWYYTYTGTLENESNYSLGHYGTYRCISADLFSKIPEGDWRHKTWIDPADSVSREGYTTLLDSAKLAGLPEYANLKFHPGSGVLNDYQVSLLVDIPLMRSEEMIYIHIEAVAHTLGVAAAATLLESYTNGYRYTDDSYTCDATDIDAFTEELIEQKRIELWGEGLTYFDLKRLALPITRTYTGTNYSEEQRLNSKAGYVAPWLNYFVPEYENAYAPSVKLNPDPSGVVKPDYGKENK